MVTKLQTLIRWLAPVTLALAMGAAHADDVIRVGATPGVTADAVEALKQEAQAQGLRIELIEFTDWTLPNEALEHGDIDLNFFQHQAFLENAVRERGYQIALIGLGLLQNIGLYSDKLTSLAQLPDGARVSIPNDPVNQGRGLLLLQRAGLITLRNGDAPRASIHDVVENPKNLRLVEIEGPQLIHSLPDVELAVVWPSYFVNAGRKAQAGTALLYSGIDDTYYAMGFAARTDRKDEASLRRFVALFQSSPTVRAVIAEHFDNDPNLYTLPWQQ